MKRILSTLLSAFLALSVLAGCSQTNGSQGSSDSASQNSTDDRLNVVATIFPGYDFTREVAGENVNLTMLLPPGSESHSYEPTPQDIITIQNADVFIYVGGDSDAWVGSILESMDTSNMRIISMMDLVKTVEEEIKEGMEDSGDGHNHGASDFDDDEVRDRSLSDWAGEWQSVYPYLIDGTLDEVMRYKAAESDADGGKQSAEDYYEYYKNGYKTDVEKLVIQGDTVTYYTDGVAAKAEYKYEGFEILTYESGGKGVRYLFEAVGETDGAPRYIQFSDHLIEPGDAEHFHLYWGDDGADALLEEMDNWPTYYPSELTGEAIAEEMLGHDEEEDAEYDEHVWTSPINAIQITKAISDVLCLLDEGNAVAYRESTSAYVEKLEELDNSFREIVQNASRDTLIFGDRFPFRYFADEYGLDYYAAFPGCSTETEASAKTVAFLIDKVNDEGIPVVFHIEFSNGKMADTICESTGAKKLLFHACHNISKSDFEGGATYLELMTRNAENLKEALK